MSRSLSKEETFKIEVFGEEELQNRIRAGVPCYPNIISIGDPGSTVPLEILEAADDLLVLRFLDLDEPFANHDPINERLVEVADLERAIDFARKVDLSKGLTVHFEEFGPSRSPTSGFSHFLIRAMGLVCRKLGNGSSWRASPRWSKTTVMER